MFAQQNSLEFDGFLLVGGNYVDTKLHGTSTIQSNRFQNYASYFPARYA